MKIELEEAAKAIIHTYEVFQIGADNGVMDEEFRYCCAEEVETLDEPWAKPLGQTIRHQIDQLVAEATTNE